MSSILVLGGAGYIGSHTVYELIAAGENVVVVDNLETGFRKAVHQDAKFYQGDIRDKSFIDSVFEKENVITRSVKLINKGDQKLKIEKIYSACLDMDNENFEMLTLHGSWARERHIQQGPLRYGKQMVSSTKGESLCGSGNTGNHSAAGQSLRNAFRIFRELYRTGRVKPV